MSDADALRGAIASGRRAVVVGMGFIGCEVAASLRQQGIEVVSIDPSPAPLFRVLGADVGRVIADVQRDHGVHSVFEDVVTRFEGDGRVERVITRSGKHFACDFAVVGVGVQPATDVVAGIGIDTPNGILVDEYCRTAFEDIYAAGDVADHYHPLFGKRMRVEHWQNAMQQGAAAARTMLGAREPYAAIHWFWSDQYDVNLQYGGFHDKWDRMVVRGRLEERSFLAFYLNQGRIDAVVGVNRGKDVRRAMRLIQSREIVDVRELADEGIDLRGLARANGGPSHESAVVTHVS